MKADELMIGSYVYVVENDYDENDNQIIKRSIEQIRSIPNGLEADYTFGVPCDEEGCEIEPIPLTEEWLLKLGFINRFGNDWTIGELHPELNKREMYIYKNDKGFFCEDFTQPIDFVHQLQVKYFGKTMKHLTFKSK